MRALYLLLPLLLPGCVYLPSVANCQHVTYTRDFARVQITAECDMLRDGVTGE
jgi:hypothetical protein